jgi:uncharacterized membrane protein
MDLIESIGIDVDMDGDVSGFDGPEYTMLTALEEAKKPSDEVSWTVSADKSEKISTSLIGDNNPMWWILPEQIYSNGSIMVSGKEGKESNSEPKLKIIPPKSIILGLLIAIAGHSLWNGSGIILGEIGIIIGLSEDAIILLTLLWIIFLVIIVLFVSSLLMRGISTISDISN